MAEFWNPTGFRALFHATLAEGFRQEPTGYARDTVLPMLSSRLDLAAIDVPVTVLYDQTHSPDLEATLTSPIPTTERIVAPGLGGSLLLARPKLVLDAAAAEHPQPGT